MTQKLRDSMEKELLDATKELARLRDEFHISMKPILPSEQNKLIALPLLIEVLIRLMRDGA